MKFSRGRRQRHKLLLTCFFIAAAAAIKTLHDACGPTWCGIDIREAVLSGLMLLLPAALILIVSIRLLRWSLSRQLFQGDRNQEGFAQQPEIFDGRRIGVFGQVARLLSESTSTRLQKKAVDISRSIVGDTDPRGRYPVQRFLISSPALIPGENLLINRGAKNGALNLSKGDWVYVQGTYGHRTSMRRGLFGAKSNYYGSVFKTNEPQGCVKILSAKPLREEAIRVEVDPKRVAQAPLSVALKLEQSQRPQDETQSASYREQLLSRSEQFEVHGGELAGDRGEQTIEDLIRDRISQLMKGEECFVYRSVRVPREDQNRSYEIDLLLVACSGVVVMEVKHWSGFIQRGRDGSWEQLTRRGDRRTFDDVLERTTRKVVALQRHFEQDNVTLPHGFCRPLVVFSNVNAELSAELLNNNQIVKGSELLTALARELPGSSQRHIAESQNQAHLSRDQVFAIAKLVAQLPSWDSVTMFGGRTVRGDIFRESFLPQAARASYLEGGAAKFQFDIPRNALTAWYKRPVVRWRNEHGEIKTTPINPEAKFTIDPAGSGEPFDIPYGKVISVELTSRG